ncbi:hypothetical protein BG000_002655, partial [Podila horticola]
MDADPWCMFQPSSKRPESWFRTSSRMCPYCCNHLNYAKSRRLVKGSIRSVWLNGTVAYRYRKCISFH